MKHADDDLIILQPHSFKWWVAKKVSSSGNTLKLIPARVGCYLIKSSNLIVSNTAM